MDFTLKDKTIFVAGGSRGIGLGIVEACLQEGANVAFTARGADALGEARRDLARRFGAERVWAVAGDMTDTKTIEELLNASERELGPVWGAVANVGIYPSPLGIEVDDENWDAA